MTSKSEEDKHSEEPASEADFPAEHWQSVKQHSFIKEATLIETSTYYRRKHSSLHFEAALRVKLETGTRSLTSRKTKR